MILKPNNLFYRFDKANEPAIKLSPPATITVETKDCFSNQLTSENDNMGQLDWECINPATGPIYIDGAEPGDALKVVINSIELSNRGTVCCVEGEGVLGHLIQGAHIRVGSISEDIISFLDMKIPVGKMVGVIGVAPGGEPINNGTPGKHGGNMDTNMIREGSTLYLPVAVDGGLFGLGDCHGVMGDGEIGVSALECPAKVNITLDVVKGKAPDYPFLENSDEFAFIVSKPTADEAISVATELMCHFLDSRLPQYSREDIIMLMSLVGQVQISQVVDPEKTVRFVFPKKYAQNAHF